MLTPAARKRGFLTLDNSHFSVIPQNSDNAESHAESIPGNAFSARCVQFVAAPGKTAALCDTIHELVVPILAAYNGFQGVIVLVARREPRLVSVYSLARMKTPAAESRWETIPEVKNLLHRVVDQCLNQDTLHAFLPRDIPQCVIPRRA
jgi:hypothetical protein